MPRQDGINNGLESPYSVGNGRDPLLVQAWRRDTHLVFD